VINNLKAKVKNLERGITLVEILVVIFIITLFSGILIVDFPKIKRQFALTRSVYRMGQDLRRTQDMSLSGLQIQDVSAKGYGIYINFADPNLGDKKYIIYADMDDDQRYTALSQESCGPSQTADCVIETIDFSQTEPGVIIDRIENTTDSQKVDISFKPPNPTITITDLLTTPPGINRVLVIFTLESEGTKERIVSVNTSGLIEIK